MRAFVASAALLASCLLGAQCTPPNQNPPPPPAGAAGLGPVEPPPPASGDRCSAAYTRILVMGCSLPDAWLDACIVARSHGSTFHLFCFDTAKTCPEVEACMHEAG